MQGLEFMVTQDPSEGGTKHPNSGVWVIRKQIRRRKQGGGGDEVEGLGSYFVVGENVYMAPSAGAVVEGRMLTAVRALVTGFERVKSLPIFDPAKGYSYSTPAVKDNTPGSSLQDPQRSMEGTPLPASPRCRGHRRVH